jgi:hypothetical protein
MLTPLAVRAYNGGMTSRRSYNADSITRALDVHLDAGRIRNWQGLGNGRFVVSLHRADDLELRSLREAYVFVAGLASAHMAPEQGSPQASTALTPPPRPWLRLTCGCLDNDAGAHRVGCPDHPEGIRGA